MSWIGVGGLTLSMLGSAPKLIGGINQKNNAKAIRGSISDPGVSKNYALERTEGILGENYNNFNLPGMQAYLDQLRSGQATALAAGSLGATSSNDILDLVSRSQSNTNNAMANLFTQQSQGKAGALQQWLNSINQVGADNVRVNQEKNQMYQSRLGEAAALEGAGMQNTNAAYDDISTGINSLYNTTFSKPNYINQVTGKMEQMPSVWDNYWKNKKNK